MKIYIGADHRGFELKEELAGWLKNQGHEVTDCGNHVYDNDDDFPDYSFAVSESVVKDRSSRGIVICGSAGGVTIAANKVKGIRCVTAINAMDVRHNREHDDANVLALAADYQTPDQAKEMIEIFLKTRYLGEIRHERRLKKIMEYEK